MGAFVPTLSAMLSLVPAIFLEVPGHDIFDSAQCRLSRLISRASLLFGRVRAMTQTLKGLIHRKVASTSGRPPRSRRLPTRVERSCHYGAPLRRKAGSFLAGEHRLSEPEQPNSSGGNALGAHRRACRSAE